MRFYCAARFAAHFLFRICLLACAAPLAAQDVTLTSRDGSIEIAGNILGYDGQFYRVDTIYGELTIDGSGVNCDGPGCPDLESFVAELEISGAATAGEVLIPALIDGFARRNRFSMAEETDGPTRTTFVLTQRETGKVVARFSVHSTNTDEGFADLLVNEADVVLSRREIRNEEAQRAYQAGMGEMRAANRARVLALDALVPIVAPGSPLTEITLADLAAVFSGRITSWAALGGPDAPISVHMRDAAAGLAQAAEDKLLAPIGADLRADAQRHNSDAALWRAVVADPFSIGLSTVSGIGNAVPLGLSGDCGFAIHASRRNAKTEDYPLTVPLFLYTPARRLPRLAREFLAYARSAPAQLVIRRAGFIDQSPEEMPIDDQGDRFANAIARAGDGVGLEELQRMVAALTPLSRLTLSFRFQAGSAALDAQSSSNIRQLAVALESGQFDGRKLVFVGFSDGAGPAEANRKISMRRAESLRRAVVAATEAMDLTRVELQVEAFGEAMPMACDDTTWGRQANRRVEVWLR
ncbi:phosphate ABC transporter substrate-binding/OmpA family protein [Pseudooceanicola sp.]|uniref:phosphate ABC transporter substrate-binding/OmpA family protein n=1 Tax=Pseudooceanicola sp. TaxID=1914328 RepID=UPI00261419DF|nr:phosphate ABC transporter substrate-binding/OmpA family protein [Pseudooceanicola sp.]MDF1855002.1 phosphate ABC transporter substrate-binding/OmpA family protein [Pseudooceanicola sp.]